MVARNPLVNIGGFPNELPSGDTIVGATAGSGVSGSAVIDFGPWPGSDKAAVQITGQTALTAGSLVQAWLLPTGTVDHSDDEVVMLQGVVSIGVQFLTAGVSFWITAGCSDRSMMAGKFNVGYRY